MLLLQLLRALPRARRFPKPTSSILALCLLLLPTLLPAQELTYQRVFQDAKACYDVLDYDCAIAKFNFLHLDIAKTEAEKAESREWLDRAKDGQLNGLKRALAKADSALDVANRVLDQMYFYKGRFGLTLKNVGERYDPKYRYGFIDRNGEEVIPFEFEEATAFSTDDGFARVKVEGKKYLLDTLGVKYVLAESLEELKPETEALDLHEQRLDSLPDNLGDFQRLKVILAYGGRLTQLPESVGQLKQLQTLDLSYNQLRNLPSEFGQLCQLEDLDLSFNSFSSLPPEFGNLKQLQFLYLDGTQLASMPPELENLQQLEVFSLFMAQFPPSEVEALRQALPNCKIIF
ncbi:MAG: leucine-rich repeat domain-containing protein [Bacteroidota bacterium]